MTPPAPAFPLTALTTSWLVHVMMLRHTSSMALMLRHASIAGCGAASMTFRWMPFENTSPPPMTSTRVSCCAAWRSGRGQAAALAGRHRPVVEVEAQHADVGRCGGS